MSASNNQTNIIKEKFENKINETINKEIEANQKSKLEEKLFSMKSNKKFYPENQGILRRTIKSSFVIGILIGYSFHYHFTYLDIYNFLKTKEIIFNKQIKALKKEIKELKRT
jgi:hypothetical protein